MLRKETASCESAMTIAEKKLRTIESEAEKLRSEADRLDNNGQNQRFSDIEDELKTLNIQCNELSCTQYNETVTEQAPQQSIPKEWQNLLEQLEGKLDNLFDGIENDEKRLIVSSKANHEVVSANRSLSPQYPESKMVPGINSVNIREFHERDPPGTVYKVSDSKGNRRTIYNLSDIRADETIASVTYGC